jgi:hypothetical protein
MAQGITRERTKTHRQWLVALWRLTLSLGGTATATVTLLGNGTGSYNVTLSDTSGHVTVPTQPPPLTTSAPAQTVNICGASVGSGSVSGWLAPPSSSNPQSDHHGIGLANTPGQSPPDATDMDIQLSRDGPDGTATVTQYFRYCCDRCGIARDNYAPVVPNSGFQITLTTVHVVQGDDFTNYVKVKKEAKAITSVAAGAGSVNDSAEKSCEIED